MRQLKWFVFVTLILSFVFTNPGTAKVKLPAVIGDNMVLQQKVSVPIWGTSEPGERVTVTIATQKASTIADVAGKWMVKLNPIEVGGPYTITIAGDNIITLYNILVGEVWVCSGQSNMQMSVKSSNNAEKEIAESNYPQIRLFSVKRTVAEKPLTDTEGQWSLCNPQTVGDFSAVGYFFGRELHKALNVPVGLIHTSWGGTPAEAWTSFPTLESNPDFKPILDRYAKALDEYPQAMEKYNQRLSEWKTAADKAKAEGKEPPPNRPYPPMGPENPNRPAGLYNGMITPIVPYAIQGAIWYQGESNASRAYQYRTLFPTMIKDWRRVWGQSDFPFLFVQLANFMETKPQPAEDEWAELREAQSMTLSLPKTGMAVIIDIGEAKDIHPKNKQDVGLRLSLSAQSVAYNRNLVYSGPMYESMTVEGNKIRLRFKHTGGGLITKNGEPVKGFAIAGDNKTFVWADAKIDGNEIVVWSDQVQNPVAVRYAWESNPVCNLYNKEGLPASPFRTDNWTGITVDKK